MCDFLSGLILIPIVFLAVSVGGYYGLNYLIDREAEHREAAIFKSREGGC